MPIETKYKSDKVAYYVRKLTAKLDRRVFVEQPPAKDWDERLERAKSAVLNMLNKSEKKILEMGEKLDEEVEKRDTWKNKFSGYFKDKFKKKSQQTMGE